MLVRVAVDPYAGLELAEGDRRPGQLLVQRLRERCLLVTDSKKSLAELLDAFRRCGSAELAAVMEQLVSHRSRLAVARHGGATPVSLFEVERMEDVATWRDVAHLLLLSQMRAGEIGHRRVEPETSTMREALNTDAFAEVESQWNWTAPAGTSRETIWAKTFGPLAAEATHLYVIDGYLLANLWRQIGNPRRVGAPKRGIEWFIGKIAQSRIRYINIVSATRSVPSGINAEEARSKVLDWWSHEFGAGPKLDLRLVRGDFPHGRRIAFDGWAGYELHKGLSTFDSTRTNETVTLNASLELAKEVRAEYRRLATRV